MSYAFIILDECIDDLESGHPGKRVHVENRIRGLQTSAQNKLYGREGEMYNHFLFLYHEYRRILYRLYDNDIKEAITMMRELQDEVEFPYWADVQPAWWRFADWRVKSLNEQAI